MTEAEKQACRMQHARCFSEVQNAVCAGAYRFAVLDEVLDAVSTGMLEERALYISYIKKIRHPYDGGLQARPGIEY